MGETMIDRRSLLRGLLAAPAIVTFGRIMPVKALALPRSTVIVGESAGAWTIFHRRTWLTLGGGEFWQFDDAAAACREIDRSFDLDQIALEIAGGRMPERERDAIYEIQKKHGGRASWPHGRATEKHARFVREQLTNSQRDSQP